MSVRRTSHPTRWIHLHGREVPVDEKITDLVILLNRAGYETTESCQDADPSPHSTGRGTWVRIGLIDLVTLQGLVRFGHAVGLETDEWDFHVWSEGPGLACSVLFPFTEAPLLEDRLRRILS